MLIFLNNANIYSRNWHNEFKRISLSYFDIANSEIVILRYINKNDVFL